MIDKRYCPSDWDNIHCDIEDNVCSIHGCSTFLVRNEQYFKKNYGSDIMEAKVIKSEGFDRVVVPRKVYKVKFKGIDESVPKGEYGERIAFEFEIVEEGEYKGKVLSTVANKRFTKATRAGKMLQGLLGRPLVEDESVNTDGFIGKLYTVLTETLSNDFGEYSVVKEIIRKVEGGSSESPAPSGVMNDEVIK